MKTKFTSILSLLAAVALTVGCLTPSARALSFFENLFSGGASQEKQVVPFSQMEYTRPDLDAIQALLDEACSQAQGKKANKIMDAVYAFYDAYDWFYTNMNLADIHYCADLSDEYWAAEYSYCSSAAVQVDQMLSSLYAALAASPAKRTLERLYFGSGYFDGYAADDAWEPDETLVSLLNRESELDTQYYAQSAQEDSALDFFGLFSHREDDMAQTLVDLILARNELADYLGYDSYEAYANDYLYARDYTPEESLRYLEDVREKLVPLYIQYASESYDQRPCTEFDTYRYVKNTAYAMGSQITDAFHLLDEGELYDIAQSETKFDSSFEIFLTGYGEPYILMNATGEAYDQLTFAHEFGHFCNDFAMGGAYSSVDVSEIFSQAMEYLSLIYAPADETLTRAKIADSLCTYVEQACFAKFEHEMYLIPAESLTVESLTALYRETAAAYGLNQDWFFDEMGYTGITHFYDNPMYILSYIYSNDAAMQIYQMELNESGTGLQCFLDNLDNEETYFLAFLESAELESPFADSRLDEVAKTFQRVLAQGAADESAEKHGLLDWWETPAA